MPLEMPNERFLREKRSGPEGSIFDVQRQTQGSYRYIPTVDFDTEGQ